MTMIISATYLQGTIQKSSHHVSQLHQILPDFQDSFSDALSTVHLL